MALPTFLIADDSEGKQMLLQGLLRHSHWKVYLLIAYSTEEAKKLIDEHPDIAFAFIDYNIPSENGPTVIAYLKKTNPQARIALTTSMDGEQYFQEARNAGAETCICTVYQLDEVERSVLELIEKWRQ
jgi:response regulator RpfG family c-di-GMP phosphodiesterase